MRKDKEQQKKAQVKQMELFGKTSEPLEANASGTGTLLLNGVELSSRLENQRVLTENILEKIVDYGNLKRAYKQLSDNGGSSGIDEMESEELREWFGENLNRLQEQ